MRPFDRWFSRRSCRSLRAAEQLTALRQQLGAFPVGEEPEVADAHKAGWQQVEQEAAQELIYGQSHESLLVAAGGIAPSEGDVAFGESNQPAVGDGDTMSVCAETVSYTH